MSNIIINNFTNFFSSYCSFVWDWILFTSYIKVTFYDTSIVKSFVTVAKVASRTFFEKFLRFVADAPMRLLHKMKLPGKHGRSKCRANLIVQFKNVSRNDRSHHKILPQRTSEENKLLQFNLNSTKTS